MTSKVESSPEKNHRVWRRVRFWGIVLASVFLLAVGLRMAMRSALVLDIVRSQIEKQVSSLLSADFQIARLNGDLWSGLTADSVTLLQGADTLLSAGSVEVAYSIWDMLGNRRAEVRKLNIQDLRAWIEQDQEGQWNVMELIPIDELPDDQEADSAPAQEHLLKESDLYEGGFPFLIRKINLSAATIHILAEAWLPEDPLLLRDLVLEARIGQNHRGLHAELYKLEMVLQEKRLDAPVHLATEASWDGRRITLDKLILASAYSLVEMAGSYDVLTSITKFNGSFRPLSWKESLAWVDEWPLQQDLSLTAHIGGNRQDLHAGLSINALGLDLLELDTRWTFIQEPVLRLASLSIHNLNLEDLSGKETMSAVVDEISMSLQGYITPGEWDRSRFNGNLHVSKVQYDNISVDVISARLEADRGEIIFDIGFMKDNSIIGAILTTDKWWTDTLQWTLAVQAESLDPGHWLGVDDISLLVSFDIEMSGVGLQPDPEPWTMSLRGVTANMPEYPPVQLEGYVHVLGDTITSVVRLESDDARAKLDAQVLWQQDIISHQLQMDFKHLNIASLPGMELLKTDLNGKIRSVGEGSDLETMRLEAFLQLAGSTVNQQSLDLLRMNLVLQDGKVDIDQAVLESAPAGGRLDLALNTADLRHPDNRLDFHLDLRDIRAFAHLAGADTLLAFGEIQGSIRPDAAGKLQFESALDLHDLQYDTIRVAAIEGDARSQLAASRRYEANLAIRGASVGAFAVRDILLSTEGHMEEDGYQGSYHFEFNVESESGIRTTGRYHVRDTISVETTDLILTDPAGTYRLEEAFNLVMTAEYLQLKPVRLKSDRGSHLYFHLEKQPEAPWRGLFHAESTDLGMVQHVFLEEPFFHALFSGSVSFTIGEDLMDVQANAHMDGFRFDSLILDSIQLALNIREDRIRTDARIWHQGQDVLISEFDLPFDAGGDSARSAGHEYEPVKGYLNIPGATLEPFNPFIESIGFQRTGGIVYFFSHLSGTSGSPEWSGSLKLDQGRVSGVALDSLLLNMEYEHARQKVVMGGRIYSLGQLAADLRAALPVSVDLQQLVFEGPVMKDSLEVDIFTDRFDLAALNDFLDPMMIRNLRGSLDADLSIRGTLEQPEIIGEVDLYDGEARVVQNNITIRQVNAAVEFLPELININRFNAQSVGSLAANGTILLDGFIPDGLDMHFQAQNFRIFNTRDLSIFGGMDLSLTGTLERPRLSGDVSWERGNLYLDNFTEREIEAVVLDEETEATDFLTEWMEQLEMEVRFRVTRNAYLRTRTDPEIFLALSGELDLLKKPYGTPEVFGDIGVTEGHVTTLGKRFQLVMGDLVFSGDPEDPELNIRTLFMPRQQNQDIRIYFLITGTLQHPEFEYQSDPEMEIQDIVSYILFGRPFHALAGWEQTISGRSDGSLATHIALDIILDRIETLAADRLGIDIIEVENTRRSGSSATTIKAGKFISDRLFIAFLQELGASDAGRQVVVEYMIQRNLDLIITASDDHRSGVDLLWKYDY